eukprot:3117315-Pyramimonas_sp.AAC.1
MPWFSMPSNAIRCHAMLSMRQCHAMPNSRPKSAVTSARNGAPPEAPIGRSKSTCAFFVWGRPRRGRGGLQEAQPPGAG